MKDKFVITGKVIDAEFKKFVYDMNFGKAHLFVFLFNSSYQRLHLQIWLYHFYQFWNI